jgi:hypothetical protein
MGKKDGSAAAGLFLAGQIICTHTNFTQETQLQKIITGGKQ